MCACVPKHKAVSPTWLLLGASLCHSPHTQVTGLWLARREELEHPLGTIPPLPAPPAPATPAAAGGVPLPGPRDFVLEIGSEELPPDDVQAGMAQLR
jgi:glycyl-tRNA synthetase